MASNNGTCGMKTITNALATLCAMAALAACDTHTVYDSYKDTPVTGWEKSDTLCFNPAAIRQTAVYNASLGMRVSHSYPYKSVTIIVERQTAGTNAVCKDTLTCEITDCDGDAIGSGVNYYQYDFPISDMSLNEGDSLSIKVCHGMKRESLPGIYNVGIRLTRR